MLGCNQHWRFEKLQTAPAGSDEQIAQHSASRRAKEKEVPRGARWEGEEAPLFEKQLGEEQENGKTRFGRVFLFGWFNSVGRMSCQCNFLFVFLVFSQIAHYSKSRKHQQGNLECCHLRQVP